MNWLQKLHQQYIHSKLFELFVLQKQDIPVSVQLFFQHEQLQPYVVTEFCRVFALDPFPSKPQIVSFLEHYFSDELTRELISCIQALPSVELQASVLLQFVWSCPEQPEQPEEVVRLFQVPALLEELAPRLLQELSFPYQQRPKSHCRKLLSIAIRRYILSKQPSLRKLEDCLKERTLPPHLFVWMIVLTCALVFVFALGMILHPIALCVELPLLYCVWRVSNLPSVQDEWMRLSSLHKQTFGQAAHFYGMARFQAFVQANEKNQLQFLQRWKSIPLQPNDFYVDKLLQVYDRVFA